MKNYEDYVPIIIDNSQVPDIIEANKEFNIGLSNGILDLGEVFKLRESKILGTVKKRSYTQSESGSSSEWYTIVLHAEHGVTFDKSVVAVGSIIDYAFGLRKTNNHASLKDV